MAGASPFLEALLAAAERAGTHLPSLKVFICGGASVPPQLIRRAQQYFERAVVTRVYGSTEVPVTTVGSTASGDAGHGADTDGRPGHADRSEKQRVGKECVSTGRSRRSRYN